MTRIQTGSILAMAVASVSTAAFGQVLHTGTGPGVFGTPISTMGTGGANTWEVYEKWNNFGNSSFPHVAGANVAGNNTAATVSNVYLGMDGGTLFGANGIVALSDTVSPVSFPSSNVFYLKSSIGDNVAKWGTNGYDKNGHQQFDIRIGFVSNGAGYVTGGGANGATMDPSENVASNSMGVFFHYNMNDGGAANLGDAGKNWGGPVSTEGLNFESPTAVTKDNGVSNPVTMSSINSGSAYVAPGVGTDGYGVAYGAAMELSAKMLPDPNVSGNVLFQVKSGATITSVSFNPSDARFGGGTFNYATAKPIIYVGSGTWGGGTTQTQTVGVFAPGDANANGTVNLSDFNTLRSNYNGTDKTWSQGDFSQDGKVNLSDFNILRSHYNQTITGPVAAAAIVLAGPPAAGKIDLLVDTGSGHISLSGGTGATLSSYEIDSASGSLDHTKWASLGLSSLSNTDFSIAEGTTGNGPSLSGTSTDIGAIFKIGGTHDVQFMAFDNSGNEVEGVVTYVPEPAALGLFAMGMTTLLVRRRKAA